MHFLLAHTLISNTCGTLHSIVHLSVSSSSQRLCKVDVETTRIYAGCRLSDYNFMGKSTNFLRKECAENVK